MLASLVNFVPTLQNASIAERLELFRSTIASFEPSDKTKDATKGIDELLDSAVGHESVMLPELHIVNSRAGLYIYLNACVSQFFIVCEYGGTNVNLTACGEASPRRPRPLYASP